MFFLEGRLHGSRECLGPFVLRHLLEDLLLERLLAGAELLDVAVEALR